MIMDRLGLAGAGEGEAVKLELMLGVGILALVSSMDPSSLS